MAETFEPADGADGWRISTPPILSMAPIRASLAIFDEELIDLSDEDRAAIPMTGEFVYEESKRLRESEEPPVWHLAQAAE